MKKIWFLLGIGMFMMLTACGGQPVAEPSGEEMTTINLPMGFVADPQFAPFYVAVEKGYYAEAEFEVEFDYGFETDGVALVGAGERPFAIVSGEQAILARAQALPVVYVLEWFQRFPIAVVSKSGSEITTATDLAGRTVGVPAFFGASYVGYTGLLAASGVDATAVNTEEIGFNQIESLLTDQVDAVVGYSNNEPVQLAARGEAINVIEVADAVDLVANGLITNETLIEEDPEMVYRFVQATLRGLADTLANPNEAYEISRMYVEGLGDDRRAVLDASLPLWEAEQLGVTEPASWENTQEVLLQIGALDAPLADLSAAYTNQFVRPSE